jgi:ATP-dependent 26S proteasome regulatory subunit
MKSETLRLQHEQGAMKEKIKDNEEKVKMNKQLPYLVANVVEVCVIFFKKKPFIFYIYIYNTYFMQILKLYK